MREKIASAAEALYANNLRSFPEKLLLAFLGYEAIEGAVRRIFANYSQQILVAKDGALVLLFLLVVLNQPKRCSAIMRKFDRPFMFLLYCFAALALIRMVGSPVSVYVQAGSLSTYFLCIPMLFMGYLCAELSTDWVRLWRILRIALFVVAIYAVFQAVTGFDTAAQLLPGDDSVATGGFYRNSGEGQVLTLASTLYGGRLASFGAVWCLVALMLLYFDMLREKGINYWHVATLVGSIVCLLLGPNRTATLTIITVTSVLFFYQLSKSGHLSRLSHLAVAGILTAVAGLVVFGLLLNRSTVALQTSDIGVFLSEVTNRDEYDVEGVNTLQGLESIYQRVGFWGAGTGSLAPTFEVREENPLEDIGAEGTPLRLLYEFGVFGVLLYFIMFGRLVFILAKRGFRAQRTDQASAFCLLTAAGMMITYLVLGYKHYGFAQDVTLQSYVFTFVGSVMGGTANRRQIITRVVTGDRRLVLASAR